MWLIDWPWQPGPNCQALNFSGVEQQAEGEYQTKHAFSHYRKPPIMVRKGRMQ